MIEDRKPLGGLSFRRDGDMQYVRLNGEDVLLICTPEGCTDSFEIIDECAFYWRRRTAVPVRQMRMSMTACYTPRYFLVPGVNYDGNGWGSGAQYAGYGDGGRPWTYAWHRVAIPACTYTESDRYAAALFGLEEGGMSCSLHPVEGGIAQELIWPETEGPKVLYKRCWEPPYQGEMEAADCFTGIVMLMEAGKKRERVRRVLDFAWSFFARDVKMRYTPERVDQLDLLFMRSMWVRRYNGLVGFRNGVNWDEETGGWRSYPHSLYPMGFEIGWCGQNGAQACAMLDLYLKTGDEDAKEKALSVLDSWDKHAFLPNGLMFVKLLAPPDKLDSVMNGTIPTVLDTCGLGTAATYFFRAAALCEKGGIERPSYRKRAFGLCDFFVGAQRPDGEFAKSYFVDGSVDAAHGTIGSFVLPPLFDAYALSGERRYLDAALRGIDFYYGEFEKNGSTTAGALDSNCIDKESCAPLLRAVLRAYETTGKPRYLEAAVDLGYYLATWQWHYSVSFPEDSQLAQLGVDTYGSTSVSVSHNALDHYGIYWIPEYVKLASLTGSDIWRQRARALWYSGIQLLSDGTLVVRGHVRPAGSQDESFRHTRWGRTDHKLFVPCEWCTVWQGTFRHLVLEELSDLDVLQ